MKILFTLLIIIQLATTSYAQQSITVSGKITDESGNALEFAVISVVGSEKATASDKDGYYSIACESGSTLEFSYVGVKKLIAVNNQTKIDVILYLNTLLEEVMVTGYQTISKERASGSFTTVKSSLLERRAVSDISQALIGLTPGMVGNIDKEGRINFVIRGTSTLSKDFEDLVPLLVVDGFAVESDFTNINPNDIATVTVLKDAAATSIYGARAANGVIVITTKGANAAGLKNHMSVYYSSIVSISEKLDLDYNLNIANAAAQIKFEDLIFSIPQLNQNPILDKSVRYYRSVYTNLLWNRKNGQINDIDFYALRKQLEETDYKYQYNKYLLRNRILSQQSVRIEGASELNNYSLSLLYENDLSDFQKNNSNKFNINFKNILNLSKKLQVSLFSTINMESNQLNGTNIQTLRNYTSPYTTLLTPENEYTDMPSYYYQPALDEYINLLPINNLRYNTLEEIRLRNNTNESNYLLLQTNLKYTLTQALSFSAMFQYENNKYNEDNIYTKNSFAARNLINSTATFNSLTGLYDAVIPVGGFRRQVNQHYNSRTIRSQFDYNKVFNENNLLVGLLGFEARAADRYFYPATFKLGFTESNLTSNPFDYTQMLTYFDNGGLAVLNYEGSSIYDFSSSLKEIKYADRFLSSFFNLSYTLKQKYTFTSTMRSDASNFVSETLRSKFSPFWATGFLWDLHKERFLSSKNNINRLLVRITYGLSGLPAGRKMASSLTTIASGTDVTYFINDNYARVIGRENKTLTWEKTASLNLGTDFSFFSNKLFGTLELYHRKTINALSNNQVSILVSGQSVEVFNNGEILNLGTEITLGTDLKLSNTLFYTGQFNFNYNYNEVLKYDYTSASLSSNLGSDFYIPGRPTDYKYVISLAGVTQDGFLIQQTGNGERIETRNSSDLINYQYLNDGVSIDEDGRLTYAGRLTPPLTLGFVNTFEYKHFELMGIITGKFGYIFSRNVNVNFANTAVLKNSEEINNLWQESDGATEKPAMPSPSSSNLAMLGQMNTLYSLYSDAVIENASHLRLDEIYLAYTIRENEANKVINSAKVFIQLKNTALIWTANKYGIDPDYVAGYAVKPPRSYSIGIKVKF